MITDTQRLYRFLSACCGSWRNSVYISTGGPGYLLSADRDGQPIVMTVEQFQQLTGACVDPAECCGHLTEEGFNSLFAQYLLWHTSSNENSGFFRLRCRHTGSRVGPVGQSGNMAA